MVGANRCARPSDAPASTSWCWQTSATAELAYGIMVPQKLLRAAVFPLPRPARRWTAAIAAEEMTMKQTRSRRRLAAGGRTRAMRGGRPALHVRALRATALGSHQARVVIWTGVMVERSDSASAAIS
jgi:hypothetical protein